MQPRAFAVPSTANSKQPFERSFSLTRPPSIAAATDVANEPLHVGFSGLLGLSLPKNSIIAQLVPPVTTDAPDGASVLANLFGQPNAPTNHSFAISLSRPGFDNRNMSWHAWPSKLALGTQIPEVINALAALRTSSSTTTRSSPPLHAVRQGGGNTHDPSQLAWAQILSTTSGYLHWRTQISEIIVTDDQGIERSISLSRSLVDGGRSSLWPVAVLDTGGSNILMRSDLANGLYGAIGIGPASDGMCERHHFDLYRSVYNPLTDYIPCKTPITVSITIGQLRLPLHPIDMSQPPANDPSSTSCVGTIQADPSIDQGKLPGDIILGVPFLRNVYVVHDLGSGDGTNRAPRFGIASLTNATLAATEFQNVRVRNLNPDGSSHGSSGNSPEQPTGDGMKTALKIGVSILCFIVVCGVLFAVLRWSMRRRLRQERRFAEKFDHAGLGSATNSYRVLLLANGGANKHVKTQDKRGLFQRLFARKGYHSADNGATMELTEDELRMQRFEEYKRRQAQEERDSIWSQSTRVRDTLVEDDHGFGHKVGWSVDEFGNPLYPLDEQRGRRMKDETSSNSSARSRTLSPGTVAAERTLMGHGHSSRDREELNMTGLNLKLDVSQATFTPVDQPTRTLGHVRMPLAVEPTLSPLTEAADSQLVTPVSTALQHSVLSYPDVRRSASPEERVGVGDTPDPYFNPFPTPMGLAARPAQKSAMASATSTKQLPPAPPLSPLRGPRPLLPSRNPYRSSSRAPPETKSQSTKVNGSATSSSNPLVTLPQSPNVTPGSHGPAAPPGFYTYMGASSGPSPIPSVPEPWVVASPTPAPSTSTTPQSLPPRPAARALAHGRLPPGAAPPMTRYQSIELLSPTESQSSGSNMRLLSSRAFSTRPNSPPVDVGPIRTATFVSSPDVWVPPPIVTGVSTIGAANVYAELLPVSIPPRASSEESIGNVAVVPGDRSSSNPATPVTSPPSSSTFLEDGHSADPPVQRW